MKIPTWAWIGVGAAVTAALVVVAVHHTIDKTFGPFLVRGITDAFH